MIDFDGEFLTKRLFSFVEGCVVMKSSRLFLVCALLTYLIISSCNVGRDWNQGLPNDISKPLLVDDVTVTVLRVQDRKSFQTHYLMHYPEPHYIYLEVILNLQDIDSSPLDLLDWGIQNITLICDGSDGALAFPRRVIADEEVEYKVGEVINFEYVYIYSVLSSSDIGTCSLTFSDGQVVGLSHLIEKSKELDSTAIPEVKGTVLSGEDNNAYGENAVIGGGAQNSANAIHTTVSGGNMNAATASHATVGGGRENIATNFYATVGGGYANIASARDTFIGGGSRNTASGPRSTIGGGIQNQTIAPDSIIAGGAYNKASDDYAFVGGGTRNSATGYASVIAGGAGNIASNDQATVAGGLVNHVSSKYGTVGGGYKNIVSGDYSTIPGGFGNKVEGNFSFATGQHAVVSKRHSGTFIFADAIEKEFPSVVANEFAARATGGVRFVSAVNSDGEIISGVKLPSGAGSWATLSDRSAKTGFKSVNRQEILALVVDLPITSWRYLGQSESVQHIGPMSQDFYASFGFGEDEQYISTVDADGVAFTAIQGLYDIIKQKETIIKNQNGRLLDIESRMLEIERKNNDIQKSQPSNVYWLGWGFLLGISCVYIGMKWQTYLSGLSRRKP
ncbi:tail fiber domain-containing protein [Chloroflexota bacterium]